MSSVNLLPEEQRRRRGFGDPKRPLIALAAVACVAAVGFWGYSARHGAAEAEASLKRERLEQTRLRADLGHYQETEARLARQRLRRGVVVGLAAGRVNWERIVRDLATVMPRQVWLTSLKAESPAPDAGGAAASPEAVPTGVHLEGYAFTQKQVALLMARSAAVGGLGDPRLTSSEAERRGGRRVVRFVLDIPIDQRAQDRPTLVPTAAPAAGEGSTP